MKEKKQPDFHAAKHKLEKVMIKWFTEDGIMLNVWCMVDKKPDPNQDTIGINLRGKIPTITYNPNFVNAVSEEALECVMASEGFKLLLRHATTRLKEPRQISSLASSVTICQLMNSDLERIMQGIDEFLPSPEKFGLPSGKFFEHYYRKLLENQQDTMKMIQKIWNSMTPEQKKEALQKATQGQEKGQEGQEQQQGQDGQGQDGQPQNDSQNGSGHGSGEYKDYDNQNQGMKDYFDPNGTSNENWGVDDLFDADLHNFVDSKKDSARDWGKFTGKAQALIVAANQPKISYKEVVRKFGKSVQSFETLSSRMKVNRRYDMMWPGRRRKYKTRVIFAVDVSGSMSDEDLKEGFAVINSVLKHAEIICVQFDTQIKSIERKMKKARNEFHVHGRGGTDFNEVLQLADKEECDGIVIYTDGCASEPKRPRAKVLWLMNGKRNNPPCSWGYRAHLERNEDVHNW